MNKIYTLIRELTMEPISVNFLYRAGGHFYQSAVTDMFDQPMGLTADNGMVVITRHDSRLHLRCYGAYRFDMR